MKGKRHSSLSSWQAHGAGDGASPYPLRLLKTQAAAVLDWGPLVESILADLASSAPLSQIAWKFHAACALDRGCRATIGMKQIALTGGVFQNKLLTELAAKGLQEAGFEVLLHQNIPPNDGGIAAGQVYALTLPHNLDRAQRGGHSPCA